MADFAPIFSARLRLYAAASARNPAENMAMDEVLVRFAASDGPILRVYDWSEPSLTLGYFQSWQSLSGDLSGDVSWTRRWTGGGLVDHRQDRTYSLILPRDEPLVRQPVRSCYRQIHRCLSEALRVAGWT